MPAIVERRSVSWLRDAPADEVVLTQAQTAPELEAVRDFRVATYRSRSNLEIEDGVDVDRRGFVLGLWTGGELTGCARVLPLPDPEAGISAMGHPVAGEHGMDSEVGRVAVAAQASARTFLALVGLGSQWMLSFTELRTFVAYCAPRLVRLYRHVGARDLGLEVVHAQNQRTYRLVAGRYDVVAGRTRDLMGISADLAGRSSDRYRPASLHIPESLSA
jgi:hypothetical protein